MRARGGTRHPRTALRHQAKRIIWTLSGRTRFSTTGTTYHHQTRIRKLTHTHSLAYAHKLTLTRTLACCAMVHCLSASLPVRGATRAPLAAMSVTSARHCPAETTRTLGGHWRSLEAHARGSREALAAHSKLTRGSHAAHSLTSCCRSGGPLRRRLHLVGGTVGSARAGVTSAIWPDTTSATSRPVTTRRRAGLVGSALHSAHTEHRPARGLAIRPVLAQVKA